jgi:hypothetical protein
MRRLLCTLIVTAALGLNAHAATYVPFKATWSGITVAADLSNFPIVAVVASGSGQGTELGRFTMVSPHVNNVFTFELEGDQNFTAAGRFTMVSPHVNNVFTFELEGDQNFTAANGDTLTAHFVGHLTPNPDGSLSGTLPCVITGGTGRFAGATGNYAFAITAVPLADGSGFASTATISGVIASVGSR